MDLDPGMDLRLPEYRREVFLRFWLHQTRYRCAPGGVYYLLPALAAHYAWSDEQKLWFAFLNGNTQHPLTSLALMSVCPDPLRDSTEEMVRFFESDWARLPFDTDRRHQKSGFPEAVSRYLAAVRPAGAQLPLWRAAARRGWPGVWAHAQSLYGFGRLSAFSYAEYLNILGFRTECEDLMLGDHVGSSSHRAGLAIVGGLEPREAMAAAKRPDVLHTGDMRALARDLLSEAQGRTYGDWTGDLGFFTLESALCTYKSWHKPNRRYPGVYNDMLYNRIKRFETDLPGFTDQWGQSVAALVWGFRRDALPPWLRLEDVPYDPGLSPVKQNHYLLTGQTVVLGMEDPQLRSSYDDAVAAGEFGVRADLRRVVLR